MSTKETETTDTRQSRIMEELRKAVELANREICRLRIQYGVVAHPERLWQGECGHLWYRKADSNSCPHCAEVSRLKTEGEAHRQAWISCTEDLTAARKEVERLKGVIAAQDKLLDYRSERIRQIEANQPRARV